MTDRGGDGGDTTRARGRGGSERLRAGRRAYRGTILVVLDMYQRAVARTDALRDNLEALLLFRRRRPCNRADCGAHQGRWRGAPLRGDVGSVLRRW